VGSSLVTSGTPAMGIFGENHLACLLYLWKENMFVFEKNHSKDKFVSTDEISLKILAEFLKNAPALLKPWTFWLMSTK